MIEYLTSELFLGFGLAGVGLASAIVSVVVYLINRSPPNEVDLEKAIREAPYERLHNSLKIKAN